MRSLSLKNKQWYINQDLTFEHVNSFHRDAKNLYQHIDINKWVLNIPPDANIDSGGLAWLLLQYTYAKNNNIRFVINGLVHNEEAMDLASVHGVKSILLDIDE